MCSFTILCHVFADHPRYQIIWLWCEGFQKTDIAQMLSCHRNSVRNVLNTFSKKGELGLIDGRVGNGSPKTSEAFVLKVEKLIAGSPPKKWNHTTWTEELLTLVMGERTGIFVSISTMCRVLKRRSVVCHLLKMSLRPVSLIQNGSHFNSIQTITEDI